MDDQPWPSPVAREDAGPDRDWLVQDAVLDLLLPEALAPVMVPEEHERARLQQIICEALEAFTLHHSECRARIAALLGNMEKPMSDPGVVDISGLPLTSFHANDYDRYFRVNRITTTQPAHVLLRSFLQVALSVTDLFCRAPHLSEKAAKAQFDGFKVHARLLARCFGVECAR